MRECEEKRKKKIKRERRRGGEEEERSEEKRRIKKRRGAAPWLPATQRAARQHSSQVAARLPSPISRLASDASHLAPRASHVDFEDALHLLLATDLAQPVGLGEGVAHELLLQEEQPAVLAHHLLDERRAHRQPLDGAVLGSEVA